MEGAEKSGSDAREVAKVDAGCRLVYLGYMIREEIKKDNFRLRGWGKDGEF